MVEKQVMIKLGENGCVQGSFLKRFIKAFTLAEVLITLGIIGIVAAMTVPALINKYKNKQAVVQLQKAYSELSQVINRASVDFGPAYEWSDWDNAETITRNYILPYYKSLKVYESQYFNYPMCGYAAKEQYSWLNHVGVSTPFTNYMISFHTNNGVCIGIEPVKKEIYIDINGARKDNKRNTFGRDIFVFVITPDSRLMPVGYDLTRTRLNADCNINGKGYYCAARIMLDNWEMKY